MERWVGDQLHDVVGYSDKVGRGCRSSCAPFSASLNPAPAPRHSLLNVAPCRTLSLRVLSPCTQLVAQYIIAEAKGAKSAAGLLRYATRQLTYQGQSAPNPTT